VAAGLLVRCGRLMLCHRSAGRRWYPDVWDLPGGHVEPGEELRQALARELTEEVGVAIDPGALGPVPDHHRVAGELDLSVWVVRQWQGEPRNLALDEHDGLRRFAPDDLDDLVLADPGCPELLPRLATGVQRTG
jgi:8-oxo-dGTP diphosphatase